MYKIVILLLGEKALSDVGGVFSFLGISERRIVAYDGKTEEILR